MAGRCDMSGTDDRQGVEGGGLAAEAHHDLVGQPDIDPEGPLAEAEQLAAEMSSEEQPLGAPGRRFDRRSPFFIGVTASAGVAVTYAAVQILSAVSSILVLIGVAFFLALGLEPAVSWLVNRRLARWAATTVVFVIFLALMGGFTASSWRVSHMMLTLSPGNARRHSSVRSAVRGIFEGFQARMGRGLFARRFATPAAPAEHSILGPDFYGEFEGVVGAAGIDQAILRGAFRAGLHGALQLAFVIGGEHRRDLALGRLVQEAAEHRLHGLQAAIQIERRAGPPWRGR